MQRDDYLQLKYESLQSCLSLVFPFERTVDHAATGRRSEKKTRRGNHTNAIVDLKRVEQFKWRTFFQR